MVYTQSTDLSTIYGLKQAGIGIGAFNATFSTVRSNQLRTAERALFKVITSPASLPKGPKTRSYFLGSLLRRCNRRIRPRRPRAASLYGKFYQYLHARWEAEDEGKLNDILNVNITKEGQAFVLSQAVYVTKMVEHYFPDVDAMHPNSSTLTPYTSNELFKERVEAVYSQPKLGQPGFVAVDAKFLNEYQSIVGALLYAAMVTRPDITYTVAMLCRIVAAPTRDLYKAALKVITYLPSLQQRHQTSVQTSRLDSHSNVGLRLGCSLLDFRQHRTMA